MPITARSEVTECAHIYFDFPNEDYGLGHLYGILTANLLGHFPKWQSKMKSVQNYKLGDIERCKVNFYIGSYYNSPLPKEFLSDVVQTKQKIIWLNYNLWQLDSYSQETGNGFFSQFHFRPSGLVGYDSPPEQNNPNPAFYSDFLYKEKTFKKLFFFDKKNDRGVGSPEIALVDIHPSSPSTLKVHAYALHSFSRKKTPYVIESKNFWYVADNPFIYTHESDRYLIFCDILFDILNDIDTDKSGHHFKKAMLRIDNIHPSMDHTLLYKLSDFLFLKKVPFSLALIPHSRDPYGDSVGIPLYIPMKKNTQFSKAINYALKKGGSLIIDGNIQQYHNTSNCFLNELILDCQEKESASFLLSLTNSFMKILHENSISYPHWFWKVHHDNTPPLNNLFFPKIFDVMIGRVRYLPFELATSFYSSPSPSLLYSQCPVNNFQCHRKRLEKLSSLFLTPPSTRWKNAWATQFFPYPIYKDYYDQKVFPENLGQIVRQNDYVESYLVRSAQDILYSAELNSVIRDGVASFIWQPQLMSGDFWKSLQELNDLIDGVRILGFEFIDLNSQSLNYKGKISTE